jgi:hypothetical protein
MAQENVERLRESAADGPTVTFEQNVGRELTSG